jgi:methyl-accepting chemotaxis protein
VADEVRKLAERSQRETKAISALIRDVQGGTREAVEAMAHGSKRVEAGAARADQAGRALDEILHAVDGTVAQVTRIADAADEMVGGARRMVDTMTDISAVVEESTAATEEMAAQADHVTSSIQSIAVLAEQSSATTDAVSASSEEMLSQVEEMSAQAQDLARTAEELRSLVSRFQLDDDDDAGQTPDAVVASLEDVPSVRELAAGQQSHTRPRTLRAS